jgi:citrate lyase beta subunit
LVASGSEPVAAGPELPADPVLAELEAAVALCRAGADAKALRRALRRIEELLNE